MAADSKEVTPAPPPRARGGDEERANSLAVTKTASRIPETHDLGPSQSHHPTDEVPLEVYNRFPKHRKRAIVTIISWCGLLSPISSTAVLSCIPEVATTYNTSGDMIGLSNALYLVFMGLSPCFWGPLSQAYGRRWTCLVSAAMFLLCSLGTALGPTLASFFVFRMLTAFAGTSFLVIGPAVIGDLYHPTTRATAMGWFLTGTLVGPTLGPVIGGIIVTFQSWRVLFWLQTALAGVGVLGAFFLLPETMMNIKADALKGVPLGKRVGLIAEMVNPLRPIRLFRFPNLILTALSSGTVVWNMYGMLTPIRYVLNPRFDLTSPAQSGLFYLAPGAGYLLGTLFGGRWADYTVRKWIEKRRGNRIAEDRLRSCLPFIGIGLPGCILIYGWTVQEQKGGIAVPVLFMFLGGFSQLFCFPSLNTYCLDVMPSRSAEVIAGNFMVRYMLGAGASALALPAIKSIGVGWFSTIAAGFLLAGTLAAWAVVCFGTHWRLRVTQRDQERREETTRSSQSQDD